MKEGSAEEIAEIVGREAGKENQKSKRVREKEYRRQAAAEVV